MLRAITMAANGKEPEFCPDVADCSGHQQGIQRASGCLVSSQMAVGIQVSGKCYDLTRRRAPVLGSPGIYHQRISSI